ncbi:hypothetical protein V6N13_036718 [Hibiscus sabdariffa]|uniref:Uncharacterized protein n=1 Tax=Hibiscus sabdariffa TaxID=183260 RepID=A0ABR2S6H0_9ROSI
MAWLGLKNDGNLQCEETTCMGKAHMDHLVTKSDVISLDHSESDMYVSNPFLSLASDNSTKLLDSIGVHGWRRNGDANFMLRLRWKNRLQHGYGLWELLHGSLSVH